MEINAKPELESLLKYFEELGEIAIEGLILHKGGKIIDVNRIVEDYTGWSKKDLIGQSTAIFVPTKSKALVEQKAKERPEDPYEIEFIDHEHRRRWGLVRGKNLDFEGEAYRIVSIVDITRIKESEAQISEQNEELKKLNKEMDELLFSSSHDLRSPISSALGLIQLLKQNKGNEKEKEEYLRLLENSMIRLDGFTRELMDFFRALRSGREQKPIEIRDMLEGIVETIKFSHNASNLKFSVQVDGGMDFISDERRVRNIVSNLVSNAVKYHDPSKEDNYVSIKARVNRDFLELEVKDNGLGIDEKFQDKIFDMFFVASDKNLGSGLGLYLVKENLEFLNGKISFNSNVRAGSEFKIIVPNQINGQ